MLKQDVILERLDRIEKLLIKQGDQLLTFEQAAKYLDFSKSYLYKLTSGGLIPHYKPRGKKVYFSKIELEEWVCKNRVKDNSEIEQNAVNHVSGLSRN